MQFYFILKKIIFFLSPKDKVKTIFLFFFILIGIILENIGIVLLLPITSLLIGAEIPEQFVRFEDLLVNMTFTNNILFASLVLMFFIYLFKNIYLALLNYFQLKFIQQISVSGLNVATGEFGADMQVELVNDGPVTFTLER